MPYGGGPDQHLALPVKNVAVISGLALMLVACPFVTRKLQKSVQKMVGISVMSTTLIFYLLNANFYPQLLTYQAGGELAAATKEKINPEDVYYWPGLYNHSYVFYTQELKKELHDSVLQQEGPVWVLTDSYSYPALKEKYKIIEQVAQPNYNVSTLSFEFLSPATRETKLDAVYIARIK